MIRELFEKIVRFASEGDLAEELAAAKQEFIARTGDLFESDDSFERRIASFLEWYVLDRAVLTMDHRRPAELFAARCELSDEESTYLKALLASSLSLFEYKRSKVDHLHVVDLLSGEKHQIFERRKPAGLESGDILEARLIPLEDKKVFSETYGFHPREARRFILKESKRFRKGARDESGPTDMVHRVAYVSNRTERYKHVEAKKIFAEL